MTLGVMGEIEEGTWSWFLLWLPGVTAPTAPSFGVLGSGSGEPILGDRPGPWGVTKAELWGTGAVSWGCGAAGSIPMLCSAPLEVVLGGRMGPLQCRGVLGELSRAAPAPAAAPSCGFLLPAAVMGEGVQHPVNSLCPGATCTHLARGICL